MIDEIIEKIKKEFLKDNYFNFNVIEYLTEIKIMTKGVEINETSK